MKKSTFIVGLSFLISKLLGIARDHLLASNFGAGSHLDTYYAAFRVPDFLFNLLSYGVLSAAFIPLFADLLKKESKDKAFEFTRAILYTLTCVMIGISILVFILAPYLMKAVVPGFTPAELQITVTLTRIMLITPVFFTMSSILSGVQNALHTFWGLSLAPIAYNLGIIGGIAFLAPIYGVYGVAIGVAIGALLNLLVQVPSIISHGFTWKRPSHFWSGNIKEMLTLSLPRIFGMSVAQLSLVIDTIIASGLAAGSIAVINLSSNIESLPMGLIGITVSIVSFGTLAAHAAEKDTTLFITELSTSIRRMIFLLVPTTLGMFLLRFQIVRLLLGRGKFNWSNTILTADTLGVFLTGLAFGSLVFILARAFYAYKDTKTPVVIGLIAVAINISLSLIFTHIVKLETYGLALSNSIADITNASLLIVLLRKKLNHPIIDAVEIWKNIIAAVVMAIVVQLVKSSFGNIFSDINTYGELIVQTVVTIAAGVGTYGVVSWMLGAKDLMHYIHCAKAFWERKKGE